MAAVKCPYCDNEFEWGEKTESGRAECPMCGKSMRVRRSQADHGSLEVRPAGETTWGTDGFANEKRRSEYGEIARGSELGGFRIDSMIGAGAMAVVYRATQLSLDRPVALKILPKAFAKRQSFVRQFDSETDLLASLNHPNIVNIIDRGREGETYYFAMEFVEGTTLGELLATGQVNEKFFIQIMKQCVEALCYAHSKGIIHRDLKPANIMLNDQGMVKIADFGVAGLVAEGKGEQPRKRRVMGTRGYMAPEQAISVDRTDERSDIFSLGAVMYRSLTDTVPDDLPPERPSKLNPEVDPRIDSLVLKCLEVEPDARYQSAQELLDAVKAYERQISRIQMGCPNCGKENPATQTTCLHCKADLSELFDECPECGARNRLDAELCMSCASNLSQLRRQTSVQISKIEENARRLVARHQFDEAIEKLQQVQEVQGKVFQRARERAQRLAASFEQARREYHEERVRQGRALAGKGRLNESLEVLDSIPAQIGRAHGLPAFIRNVQSRMALAKRRIASIGKLLEERRTDEAEKLLGSVRRMWVDCPGLSDAKRQVAASRETSQMVEYELAEVRRYLEEGNTAEARRAVDFALQTMPDNPEVKLLVAEIERRERAGLLRTTLTEGRKAFDKGDFREAVRYWTAAFEALPPDDERRQKVHAKIETAREKWLERDVVLLEDSEVVLLRPAQSWF